MHQADLTPGCGPLSVSPLMSRFSFSGGGGPSPNGYEKRLWPSRRLCFDGVSRHTRITTTMPDFSPQTIRLDASLYADDQQDAENRQINADLVTMLNAAPDMWSFPPEQIRKARARGRGALPYDPADDKAYEIEADWQGHAVRFHVVPVDKPTGVMLFIHGGGWTFGTADQQDRRLRLMADESGMTIVSLRYRLAPEHPSPAAQEDCLAAARWLHAHAATRFGTNHLVIGGESAGAHLALLTLISLRENADDVMAFRAASLVAGCYDLGLSPSARLWGTEKLILNTRDVRRFVASYLHGDADKEGEGDLQAPNISPLYADLHDLPPMLVSVGTRDLLLDDSTFLAHRLASHGNDVQLSVWPGGAHVFQAFETAMARASLREIGQFLRLHGEGA